MVAGYWWYRSAIDSWIEVQHIASTNVFHTIVIEAKISLPHIAHTNTFPTVNLELEILLPHIEHTNIFPVMELLGQGGGSSSLKSKKKTAKRVKYTSPYLEHTEIAHIRSVNKFYSISVKHIQDQTLANMLIVSAEDIAREQRITERSMKLMQEEEEFLLSMLLEIA